MVSVFFIDAYRPFIGKNRNKEPQSLAKTRAVFTTLAIVYLFFNFASWVISIRQKQTFTTRSDDLVSLPSFTSDNPSDYTYISSPNARICLVGSYDLLVANNVKLSVKCTISTANGNATDCGGTLTPLEGYKSTYSDYSVRYHSKIYYPFWRDGYCFHYASDPSKYYSTTVMRFDMFASPPLNSTVPPIGSSFDVTLLDGRNDPIVGLYNLTDNHPNKNDFGLDRAIKRFIIDDDTQQPSEFFLSNDEGQRLTYQPYWSNTITPSAWNYLGVMTIYESFWALDTTNSPAIVSPGASSTVEIALSTNFAYPYISTETRNYTLSVMFVALYTIYMAFSNFIYHFFGHPGTSNPFGYCSVFFSQAFQANKMKNYGSGETLPFHNLPTDAGNAPRDPHLYDVNMLAERLLNLEAVLADYYIDVGKFQNLSKVKAEAMRPKSTTQMMAEFVEKVVQGEKDNLVSLEKGLAGGGDDEIKEK